MKRPGKVIYFGEELDDFDVEIQKDTILIDGRPLIPGYALNLDEESEFALDEKTQKIVEKSLHLLDPHCSFEDNAERVAAYLSTKGLTVRRDEFYGDVLLETGEGYGVAVLFNEEARIKMSTTGEIGEDLADHLEELGEDGLVIVDKGFISLIPKEEAAAIEEKLKRIYASKEDIPTKIREIQDLLGIPEESARTLLQQHS